MRAEALSNALNLDRRLGQSPGIGLDLIYAGDNEARRHNNSQARSFHERAMAVYTAAENVQGAASVRARMAGLPK